MSYTKQEAFEKALRGVIAQGALARMPNGSCSYRLLSGARCGVGQLCDNEDIIRLDREDCLSHGIDEGLDWLCAKIGLNPWFLSQLQRAHDVAENLNQFWHNMNALAVFNKLAFPADVPCPDKPA